MLDMHAVTGTGSIAALVPMDTILPGGDKATVAGVPIVSNAVLVMWGAEMTATGVS